MESEKLSAMMPVKYKKIETHKNENLIGYNWTRQDDPIASRTKKSYKKALNKDYKLSLRNN